MMASPHCTSRKNSMAVMEPTADDAQSPTELFEEDMWSNIFADDDDDAVATGDQKVAPGEWHHLSSDDDDAGEDGHLAAADHWTAVYDPRRKLLKKNPHKCDYRYCRSLSGQEHRPSHRLDDVNEHKHPVPPAAACFDAPSQRFPLVVLPVATTALSKPLCRFDGLVIVGTEGRDPHDKSRVVVSNFRSTDVMTSLASVSLPSMVRDLQWVTPTIVAAAVGKDLQLIQVGPSGVDAVAVLMGGPITMAHSDDIRETAVPPPGVGRDGCILSGGFDETVCITDLDKQDIILKFDARNVVSSVRWLAGDGNHVSWTTDGGMFSIADLRVRSSTGQINFDSPLTFGHSGGLYSHDYLSPMTVVLGYESGHVACLDLRRPTKAACYLVCKTPLEAVGEVRKVPTMADCALFGAGGFSLVNFHTATLDATQWHISFSARTSKVCKTSGDFALGDSNVMAVSDSVGMVSVFDLSAFASTTTGPPPGSCSLASALHPMAESSPRSHAMSF